MSNGLTRTIAIRTKPRPSIEKAYPWILSIFIGYCAADLAVLGLRGSMMPAGSPSARPFASNFSAPAPRSQYSPIVSRNMFTNSGVIPDALGEGSNNLDSMEVPVQSQLPLSLVGTIVLSNPSKSIATIQVRGRNQGMAFLPNRDIDQIATLIRVERNRIVIRNRNNNRLEFIENKADAKISFGAAARPASGVVAGPANVKVVGENKYEINHSEVVKFTSDLSSIVMQASTIPRRKSNGEIDGFTITTMQPGSVFGQLGLMPMDTIKSVNGEPIDSPAKAIELYNAMKNTSNVKIMVERDGRDVEMDYSIKK